MDDGAIVMAGSLLGYFFCLGTAFAAITTFFISVLGDSTALSRVSRHPSYAIMRNASANEARALKKQEHLRGVGTSEKGEIEVSSGNPDQPLAVTSSKGASSAEAQGGRTATR